MECLLLVDDQSKDLLIARQVAQSLGIPDIQTQNSVQHARKYLEKALKGEVPLPDAIILDLDFGTDSGFELLRFRYTNPRLCEVPVLVWSILEEHVRLCELFKINTFVSKWRGADALREALKSLTN